MSVAPSEPRLHGTMPFAVAAVPRRHQAGKAAHSHPEGQFAMVATGLLIVDVDGASWMIPAGRIGWVPPGLIHAAAPFGVTSALTVHVQPRLCGRLPNTPTVFRATALLEALFDRIATWVPQGTDLTEKQHRLMHVFLDELETSEPETLFLPMPQDSRLQKMAATVAANPSNGDHLATWGVRIGMSERALTRQFRVETGMSFVQWRTMAKMKRALEMLAGGASVTNTSLDLGYDSVSSFIAMFRRTFGVTPTRQKRPSPSAP